jgi:hypothetical protein
MDKKTVFDFGDGNGPVPAHKHVNGGGWVADTAYVADTAFVGPEALVYGSARVYGNAICTKDPTVISGGLPWVITVYDNVVAIGCQQRTLERWMRMNRSQARKLDKDSDRYFKKIKQLLKAFVSE